MSLYLNPETELQLKEKHKMLIRLNIILFDYPIMHVSNRTSLLVFANRDIYPENLPTRVVKLNEKARGRVQRG